MTADAVLVGECNPYGGDPRYALFPEPERSAGGRLCRVILGLGTSEYMRRFRRYNLCVGRWAMREARGTAAEIRRAHEGEPLVLLGARVSAWQACGSAGCRRRLMDNAHLYYERPRRLLIRRDGARVLTPGMEFGPISALHRKGARELWKKAGHHHWSGQGQPWKYSPVEFWAVEVLEQQEDCTLVLIRAQVQPGRRARAKTARLTGWVELGARVCGLRASGRDVRVTAHTAAATADLVPPAGRGYGWGWSASALQLFDLPEHILASLGFDYQFEGTTAVAAHLEGLEGDAWEISEGEVRELVVAEHERNAAAVLAAGRLGIGRG